MKRRRKMESQFARNELLIGKEKQELLKEKKVAIFGLGGVGSYVLEGLVRAGIGKFILIDNDTINLSNLNRQLLATTKTIGRKKVEVAKERVEEIYPEAKVEIYDTFYLPGHPENILEKNVDYVVDAVDTVTAKILIIQEAKQLEIPVISSMGTGNKLDATKFEVADISKTSVCPLAKVMRKELKKRNIEKVKVVFSKEKPIQVVSSGKEQVPGSISFVPSVAGLIIAGEVVKDLCEIN